MEYIYATMLIHKAGGKIDEASIKKVLESAGVKPDDARVRGLVAALEGVNIEEAMKKAAMPVAAAAPAEGKVEKKEEEKSAEDEKKTEEAAAAGLGALFG